MSTQKPQLPELPLDAWEDTKMTVHLFAQIVGKIRLKMMPRKNHWWSVTLYASPTGLTTHPIPYADGFETFEITLNLLAHRLELVTSRGESEAFPLEQGLSVAEFHRELFDALERYGIRPHILDKPYDLPATKPFSEITEYASYQPEYVERYWRIMLWVNGVFEEFSGRFYGKTCPVHLYWHHMDLAVTRFSGKKEPPLSPDRTIADKDAYTHEVISFGFWAGDENVRAPAFYSYTFPSPEGLDKEPLSPGAATWADVGGSPMAMLMYDDLRREADPRKALLDYLESAYQAGAKLAGWDIEALTVPPLSDL
jgi:hypothetical protein